MKIIDVKGSGIPDRCYETAHEISEREGLTVRYGSLFKWNRIKKAFTLEYTHHCYNTDDTGQIFDPHEEISQDTNKKPIKDWNVLSLKWTKNHYPPVEIITKRWNKKYRRYDAIYLEDYVPPHVKPTANIHNGEMGVLPPKQRLKDLKS